MTIVVSAYSFFDSVATLWILKWFPPGKSSLDVFLIWTFSEMQEKMLNLDVLDFAKYWADVIQCNSDNYGGDVID